MSFMASPWDYPDTFERIPQITLRAVVDPTSWEVIDITAKLIFGFHYMDIMFPSQ
jgi:hypothetical protein